MCPAGTEDKVCPKESEWTLVAGEYAFDMKNAANRERTLAFARLLGYVHTDGCLSYNAKRDDHTAVVYMGSTLDVNSIMEDVFRVTGKTPKVQDCDRGEGGSKTYNIYLPYSFARALASLEGMVVGRCATQAASYPTFLFKNECPTSIVREFLGGCFGGDGGSPYLSGNTFSDVQFSQSICQRFEPSMISRMEQFIGLMKRVGVDAKIVRTRLCKGDCESYITDPRVTVEIKVDSNEQFRKNIGFRHCIEKLLRLEVAASYEQYCEKVKEQHNEAIRVANEYLAVKKSIPEALAKVKELYTDTLPLNDYYSMLTPTLLSNRRKAERSTNLRAFDYTFMKNAQEYLKMLGCETWFSKESYIIPRDVLSIPAYNFGIMKKEAATVETVYDIGVAHHHMFVANGTVVFNCVPSRMTIAQLMETLMSKIGCCAGALGDGTPFNATTVDGLATILRDQYGLEPYGNEIMYNGYTGRMMETSIFIGPCYYQRLRHCSADKLHSRASGPLVMLTRQPAEGRAREGGLRFGEMERDCVIGHGMSEFTQERLMKCSDAFSCYSCRDCGLLAIANPVEGVWCCKGCGNTTKFSHIQIPYASKLLLQELESMCIGSRLITNQKLLRNVSEAESKKC